MIADLPTGDRVVLLDAHRRVVEDIAANLERTTPERRADLARLLLERVEATGRQVTPEGITWTPPARPLLRACCRAPPDGFEPPTQALGRPRSIH